MSAPAETANEVHPATGPDGDDAGSTRPARSFGLLGIGLCAVAVSLLLHARSFWTKHDEQDERVYLALAREMGWDVSHYTTRDVPWARRFPWSIYRQPVFHQPPLFPIVLKVGRLSGKPVVAGLLFANASMALLLFSTGRWMALARVPPRWAVVGFAGMTFCPLLLASTSLLHLDGLLGIYLASGLVAYVEALERPTLARSALAGGLLAAALNLRYNALLALPTVPLLQAYQLHRLAGRGGGWRVAREGRHWRAFAVVSAMVLALGLPHYYRILATYGTLRPGRFIVPDPDIARFSDYLGLVTRRGPGPMVFLLVAVFPILLAFLTPWPYRAIRDGLRERSWGPIPLVAFLVMLPAEFAFSYQQMRFFAAEMPLLYLGLPDLLRRAPARARPALIGLAGLSLLSMITTGFARTVMVPADAVEIIPSLFYYLPPLFRYYR